MRTVFRLLNEMVRDGELENYAVTGAIAAMFYIEPFATQDVDIFITMERQKGGLIARIPGWDFLQRHGFTEIRGEALVVDDWSVQFIPVSDALDEEAYLNAATVDYEGEQVRVVLAEHLVAIMIKVGRLKDLARAQMFLTQDAVDRELLVKIIERHNLHSKWSEFHSKVT